MTEMLFELQTAEFPGVRPLFDKARDQLVVDSVIDGFTPGRVAVDDLDHPRVSCLWNRMDALVLAGAPGDEGTHRALARLIRCDWAPDALHRQIPWFHWYASPAWSNVLGEILAPVPLVGVDRRRFRWDGFRVDWRSELSPSATVAALDDGLLARADLANIDRVHGWILSFWHSLADFGARGIGTCVIVDDTVASWCLSVFLGSDRVELGVETAPAFRGTPHAERVSNVVLSVATTDAAGTVTVCEPKLSSTVTVVVSPEAASSEVALEQAVRARAASAMAAALRYSRGAFIYVIPCFVPMGRAAAATPSDLTQTSGSAS